MITTLLLLAVVLLAYTNGANDNFKGVATLFGSGTARYRRALVWAAATTFAGSLMALLIAQGLVESFQGKGLVADEIAAQPSFLFAVSIGAALTVLAATAGGLPISTTHALTGALVGAGMVASQGALNVSALTQSFLLPLLCSPLIAMLMTVVLYPVFGALRRGLGVTSHTCLCVGSTYEPLIVRSDGSLIRASTGIRVDVDQMHRCVERYQGRMWGVDAGVFLDGLHYVSAGAVGFARGLNDTPKIVAVLIAAQALPTKVGLGLVAVAMAMGGILNARPVAHTMSRRITNMNPGQGFSANLVTSLLVIAASRWGLPVSTTHVSVGALFGIGTVNRTARWRMVLTILLAWVVTLPLAAFCAALGCFLAQWLA